MGADAIGDGFDARLVSKVNCDAAGPGNGTLVNFTRIAGRIDETEPDGPVSEQRRQNESDYERADSEKG